MQFKARRGAVIVMLGITMVALMSVAAIAIDFSRLWTLRNELQTSADAAAHAGAIQLLPPNNAGDAVTVATSYATANLAMQGTVTVDSAELGDWDDINKTFTPAAPHTDAVRVVVSRQSTGLIMNMMGVAAPRLKARAIGWADAPVATSAGCIKPTAVPFTQLMWRINNYRGISNSPDTLGLYRSFDSENDLPALSNMTDVERTFSLKLGSGQVNDTLGQLSGNYQAVKLGKYWSSEDSAYADPGPDNGGASAFVGHMSGETCYALAVGDSLRTEPGNMAGPTVCGAYPAANGCGQANGPGICSALVGESDNTPKSDPTYGDCLDAQDNVGVDIKAAFYRCVTGCNGLSTVEVSLLGSFTLTKVYPAGDNGQNPDFDKAEIVGIFKPINDPGQVGPGSTMLIRPILVK